MRSVFIILFFLSSNLLADLKFESTPQTLILHMDVNKTLIAVDPASHQSLDQVINALLAEKFKYLWTSELPTPISYQAFVENYLLPGPSYDQELKTRRRILINNFVNELATSAHPLSEEILKDYLFIHQKLENHFVFPSFIKLIYKLKSENIKFHIILRTFGYDLDDVIAELENIFPDEKFSSRGYFDNEGLNIINASSSFVLSSPEEIYQYLKTNGHVAIQDNWKDWNEHQEDYRYAKKFFINREDEETISLFFDDHLKENPWTPKNILAPLDIHTGEYLSIQELVEQGLIFKVDTYQAITDEDYYIRLVDKCLQVHSLLL